MPENCSGCDSKLSKDLKPFVIIMGAVVAALILNKLVNHSK